MGQLSGSGCKGKAFFVSKLIFGMENLSGVDECQEELMFHLLRIVFFIIA